MKKQKDQRNITLCKLGGSEKIQFVFDCVTSIVAPRRIKPDICISLHRIDLLRRARKLGDSLGTLAHGVLGKFSRQHETDGSLNFARRKSSLLAESGQTSSFRGNAIKDIVDKGVHDGHALFGDSGIRMNLLEYAVNVSRPRFNTLLGALASRGLLGCLLGRLLGWCLGHFEC